ncbi:hypothetical protein CMI37_16805 [Candidatus Pacearchaeota archaeon]|nr:hypothetical protein [Candidatus Pacearchaeota archaeon]
MVRTSVSLGMTLKMASGGGFNMFKPEISISDIEVGEGDEYNAEAVEKQVTNALQAMNYAYAELEDNMFHIVETSSVSNKGDILTELKAQVADLQKRFSTTLHDAVVKDTLEESVATDTTSNEEVVPAATSDVVTTATKDDEDDDDW